MNREELEQKVMQIVADLVTIDVEDVKIDSGFVNDLNFDSLDAVEMIMMTEDEFDIGITDEEAERLTSVSLLVNYIEKKIA